MKEKSKKISIIIPFFNEENNLKPLYEEVKKQLSLLDLDYQIIFVDDGSVDKGAKVVRELSKTDNRITFVKHQRQMGKGAALKSGLTEAKGEVIVFMDADLQDDPADIKNFLAKLDEGYDLVNGKRSVRKDNFIIKAYSKLFNWFLKSFLKSPFTDINCGFKAFKKKVYKSVPIYANNFRFFPLAAFYSGFRVSEIGVNNRPRLHGKSKFGIKKIFIGILDTLTAFFIYKFAERPLHFFGSFGGITFLSGIIILLYLTIERVFFGQLLYRRPILQLGVLLVVIGVQIVMTGFLGELIVYMKKQEKK